MPYEPNIDLHAPTANNGLTRWNVVTGDIVRTCRNGSSRIDQLVAMAPWGDDSAGQDFAATYTGDCGPEVLKQLGWRVADNLEALGLTVATAVSNTRGTDQEGARKAGGVEKQLSV
ncbi:hypothetical protein [Sphaerisporangium fuscum]|uniref:hypothetical protein n=1 Tax=Sphaerisporangium fuscum TaxID=2835868 RepID=UPI001BDD6B30|nr:hypothetical protein [Sphaerisporangium fuscum]